MTIDVTIAAQVGQAVAADLVATDETVVHRTGQAIAQPINIGEIRTYYVTDTYAGGLSGTGTAQGGATLLAANKNVATTVTGAANAFRMPAGNSVLHYIVLFNDDAADNLQLFPAVGEDIGAGVNLPLLIAPGDWARFEHKSASVWYFAAGTVSI